MILKASRGFKSKVKSILMKFYEPEKIGQTKKNDPDEHACKHIFSKTLNIEEILLHARKHKNFTTSGCYRTLDKSKRVKAKAVSSNKWQQTEKDG